MRIRIAVPDRHAKAGVLDAALEATTRANQAMIEADEVPLASTMIRRGKVRWKPEPKGQGEHFDLGETVARRGWGDCDDLAPWLAAELRATGKDRGARARVVRSGPKLWHAIVQKSDGSILDPSKAAGMKKRKPLRGHAVSGMMASPGQSALGLRRYANQWLARCDLPLDSRALSISGVALAHELDDAISDAIEGACVVGQASQHVDPDDLARALALQSLIAGADIDDVADILEQRGHGEAVGFLPLAAAALPLAAPMLSKLLPGGGGKPAAAAPGGAPGAATTVAPAPGAPYGGGPVSVTPYGPGGPVIVRF